MQFHLNTKSELSYTRLELLNPGGLTEQVSEYWFGPQRVIKPRDGNI